MLDQYYKILGLPSSSSHEEIKKKFRSLAQIHHPDKGGNVETFKKISEAYNILMKNGSDMQGNQPGPTVRYDYYENSAATGGDWYSGDDIFGASLRRSAERAQQMVDKLNRMKAEMLKKQGTKVNGNDFFRNRPW